MESLQAVMSIQGIGVEIGTDFKARGRLGQKRMIIFTLRNGAITVQRIMREGLKGRFQRRRHSNSMCYETYSHFD